jgi:hypothetical protein
MTVQRVKTNNHVLEIVHAFLSLLTLLTNKIHLMFKTSKWCVAQMAKNTHGDMPAMDRWSNVATAAMIAIQSLLSNADRTLTTQVQSPRIRIQMVNTNSKSALLADLYIYTIF